MCLVSQTLSGQDSLQLATISWLVLLSRLMRRMCWIWSRLYEEVPTMIAVGPCYLCSKWIRGSSPKVLVRPRRWCKQLEVWRWYCCCCSWRWEIQVWRSHVVPKNCFSACRRWIGCDWRSLSGSCKSIRLLEEKDFEEGAAGMDFLIWVPALLFTS